MQFGRIPGDTTFDWRLFCDEGLQYQERDKVHMLEVLWKAAIAVETVRTQDHKLVVQQFDQRSPAVEVPLPLVTRFKGTMAEWKRELFYYLDKALDDLQVAPSMERGPLPDYIPLSAGMEEMPGPSAEPARWRTEPQQPAPASPPRPLPTARPVTQPGAQPRPQAKPQAARRPQQPRRAPIGPPSGFERRAPAPASKATKRRQAAPAQPQPKRPSPNEKDELAKLRAKAETLDIIMADRDREEGYRRAALHYEGKGKGRHPNQSSYSGAWD